MEYYSKQQVCEQLGIHPNTLTRWLRRSDTPVKPQRATWGRALLFLADDIARIQEWRAEQGPLLEEAPASKPNAAKRKEVLPPADLSAVLDYPVELLTDEQRGLFDTKMNWSISQGYSQESAWNWARNFVCAQFLLGEYAGEVYNPTGEGFYANGE